MEEPDDPRLPVERARVRPALALSGAASVGVPAYSLFDFFASAKITSRFDLRGGITNLADKSLPYVASSQNGTDVALYDPIGRSFYLGVKGGF